MMSEIKELPVPTIDMFMQALLLMDKDSTKEFREKLNKIAQERINNDAALQHHIEANDILDFNLEYISRIHSNLQERTINAYKANIITAIVSLSNMSNQFEHMLSILKHYSNEVSKLKNTDLIKSDKESVNEFTQHCVYDSTYTDIMVGLHVSYCNILKHVSPHYKNQQINNDVHIKPFGISEIFEGFEIRFSADAKLEYIALIKVGFNISVCDLSPDVIRQSINYFNHAERFDKSRTCRYDYMKTLAYVTKTKMSMTPPVVQHFFLDQEE